MNEKKSNEKKLNENKSNQKKSNENKSHKPFSSNKVVLIKNNNLSFKNNTNFPSFKYEGGNGFDTVQFTLKPNESIRADAGAMNYMTDQINVNTTIGSITGAIFRKFSGSSAFYNIFKNESKDDNGLISLSSILPGSVGCFYIPKGESFLLVSNSYIASTPELEISTALKFGGFALGNGLTFVKVTAKNEAGLVWASSLGNIVPIILKPNESISVDNGILLGFDSSVKINTRPIGGFYSTFFSGEGFVSKIKNENNQPITIYLESRSKIGYRNYIKDVAKNKKNITNLNFLDSM